jgi:hypothetical protein
MEHRRGGRNLIRGAIRNGREAISGVRCYNIIISTFGASEMGI